MNAFLKTCREALLLLAVGIIAAFAINAVRGKDSIRWSRNYFAKPKPIAVTNTPQTNPNATKTADNNDRDPGTQTNPQVGLATDDQNLDVQPPPDQDSTGPGFLRLLFEDVVRAYERAQKFPGLIVFVDARDDMSYQAGHIPGAIQCDHYRIDAYIDDVLARAMGAEMVIVYCNGGDCEDSLFVANDLYQFGVPLDVIHVYEGGWEEWVEADLPTETN